MFRGAANSGLGARSQSGYKASAHLVLTFGQPVSFANGSGYYPMSAEAANFNSVPDQFQTASSTNVPWTNAVVASQSDEHGQSSAHCSSSLIRSGFSILQLDIALGTDSSSDDSLVGVNIGSASLEGAVVFFTSQPTTVSIVGTISAAGRGSTRPFPELPNPSGRFFNVKTGEWFDPPIADGFKFQMDSASTFTDILELPTDIIATNKQFEVWVNQASVGKFSAGQGVNFVNLIGAGVTNFVVTGITPAVDGGNPEAFPIKLAFSTPTADFTMTPIPVPYLGIQHLNNSTFRLTWPTNNADGYVLESTTNLAQSFWNTVLGSPTLSNDIYTVAVGTNGASRYYRLKKP